MAPSVLLLLFVSSALAAASAAAAEDGQGGSLCPPALCGDVRIAYPFGIAPPDPEHADAAASNNRNCAVLGFQVGCHNNTPYLWHNADDNPIQILDIFYGNGSLIVRDVHKLQLFDTAADNSGHRRCHIPENSSSKLGLPFSVSPTNQNLIFYNCTEAPSEAARGRGLVETVCRNNTFVRVADRSNGESGNYFLEGCEATVVPVIGGSGHANASDYNELITDGFLLTWSLPPPPSPAADQKISSSTKIGIACGAVGSILVLCFLFIVWHKRKRKLTFFRKINNTTERNIEALIVSHGSLAPKRYKYSEAIKITSSLNNKLGEGSYGMVFKGRLDDGRLVAVKFLHDSKGEGEEFVNEVMSIGRTSHVNVVSLFGFCLEGSKRALIYEYMPNGSLDKYIYSENPKAVLGWDKLYTIALGIARGLEYLHHSCNTRIVHFDIKPQNILLDHDFCPKIADFGLAKLCHTKESKLSMTGARGTIGFIAPEVHSRTFGVVSTKSDVYSYGMMLLEMVGGRKNVKSVAQKSSEKYFPHWIYDHFDQDEGLEACEVTSENEGIAKKMSVIGLWCIQILPMHRPTITRVLEMFERGLDDLGMPPRQNFSQILEDPACNLHIESLSVSKYQTTSFQ